MKSAVPIAIQVYRGAGLRDASAIAGSIADLEQLARVVLLD